LFFYVLQPRPSVRSRNGDPREGRIGLEKKEGRLASSTSPSDRRFTDQPQAHVTLIGPDTLVRGDVRSNGPVEIRGTLEGDCQTAARCIVHEGGRVLGNIDAAALIVAGRVEAGVLVADKIELRATASVQGVIRARVLAIEDGALYEGSIEGTATPGSPSLVRDRRGREPEER